MDGQSEDLHRSSVDNDQTSDQMLEDGEVLSDDDGIVPHPSATTTSLTNVQDTTATTMATEKNSTVNHSQSDVTRSVNTTDDTEEGEVTLDSEREAIKQQVDEALYKSLKTGIVNNISQKEARYFLLHSVVCSNCGLKGHMSFSCTEKDDDVEETHSRRNHCLICSSPRHMSRDCPRGGRRGSRRRSDQGQRRQVGAPRQPILTCYVCNQPGHLDCSVGKSRGLLSCSNCGMAGHTHAGCDLPRPHVIHQTVRTIERERKDWIMKMRNSSRISKKDLKKTEIEEYRHVLMDRIFSQGRFSRYGIDFCDG